MDGGWARNKAKCQPAPTCGRGTGAYFQPLATARERQPAVLRQRGSPAEARKRGRVPVEDRIGRPYGDDRCDQDSPFRAFESQSALGGGREARGKGDVNQAVQKASLGAGREFRPQRQSGGDQDAAPTDQPRKAPASSAAEMAVRVGMKRSSAAAGVNPSISAERRVSL